MKNKIICTLIIVLFLMAFAITVHAEEQQIIDEDELETRFAKNSEDLLADLQANATVVVPAPDDHECRFAILWKKVEYENGQPVSDAAVTINSDYSGTEIRAGFLQWSDPPVTKTTDEHGSACFVILWDHHPPESITITITVSKDGLEQTEEVELNGKLYCYQFKCIHNTLSHPPSAPELALTTPIVTSLGAAVFFWFKRKRGKQTI
jgi:hypothetical protein